MTPPPRLNAPLRFAPLLKVRVWGGNRLKTRTPAPPPEPVGESWEICDRDDSQSIVLDGPWAGRALRELFRSRRDELCGAAVDPAAPDVFPLMLKLLDPSQNLSVQVHPGDAQAARVRSGAGELGKTEAWVVLESGSEGQIYRGFRDGATRDDFAAALARGDAGDWLRPLPARPGDVFHLPAGTVHALGAGVRVAEIQQNSDATYRIFDWNRLGLDGRPRELHVADALAAADFSAIDSGRVRPRRLSSAAGCRELLLDAAAGVKFTLERWTADAADQAIEQDEGGRRFLILTLARGRAALETAAGRTSLVEWDSALIPAAAGRWRLTADAAGTQLLVFGGVAR